MADRAALRVRFCTGFCAGVELAADDTFKPCSAELRAHGRRAAANGSDGAAGGDCRNGCVFARKRHLGAVGKIIDDQRRLLAGIEERHIRRVERGCKLFFARGLLFLRNKVARHKARCRLAAAGRGDDRRAAVYRNDLPLLVDRCDRLVARGERHILVARLGKLLHRNIVESLGLVKGNGACRERQSLARNDRFRLLLRLFGLIVLFVHILPLGGCGGRGLFLRRLLRLNLCFLLLHAHRLGRAQEFREPAELIKGKRCPHQNGKPQNHADRDHHPLWDLIRVFHGLFFLFCFLRALRKAAALLFAEFSAVSACRLVGRGHDGLRLGCAGLHGFSAKRTLAERGVKLRAAEFAFS